MHADPFYCCFHFWQDAAVLAKPHHLEKSAVQVQLLLVKYSLMIAARTSSSTSAPGCLRALELRAACVLLASMHNTAMQAFILYCPIICTKLLQIITQVVDKK
jgi:hypothetical protein